MRTDLVVTTEKPAKSRVRTVATTGVETTLAMIGGQWKVLILYLLASRPHRFSELKQTLVGVTGKMLSQQLRQLSEHKVVVRKPTHSTKNHVTYRLSPAGEGLRPILKLMCDWGQVQRDAYLRMARMREAKALVLEQRIAGARPKQHSKRDTASKS